MYCHKLFLACAVLFCLPPMAALLSLSDGASVAMAPTTGSTKFGKLK